MKLHKQSILLLSLIIMISEIFLGCYGDRKTSIIFTTLGRSHYAFDIYTLPIHQPTKSDQLRITDGHSVNFNGFFPNNPSSVLSLLNRNPPSSSPPEVIVYITERNGSSNIYLDAFDQQSIALNNNNNPETSNRRSTLQNTDRLQVPLLHIENHGTVSMKDKPSISGEFLIYVSTHENPELPRKSWAAVYSTHLRSGKTRRLTPYGIADYSPAVSPSGEWTAVVSHGQKGWMGEIQDLKGDLYLFKTSDGSQRKKIVHHGGWPTWADDSSIYFHRQSNDGWWSVYKAVLRSDESVTVDRVTPPGIHAFTPAASTSFKSFIVVATRRPSSDFRHIELFDLENKLFIEMTKPISPKTHHYNPFFTPDSTKIGFHRCRGDYNSGLLLENLQTQLEKKISLFRIDGSFPSFSPAGNQIAYVGLPGLYVVNSDGSGKRELLSGNAFATAWDWKRKGLIYTSYGPEFASESTKVDVISIDIEKEETKVLTIGGENNAFPSASPDGKWVVFRSGRSGHKNLYVMDAVEGEKAGIRRLTEGPWTDTMCDWSPDGEWIAFASDRDNPGGDSFALYKIRPDGTQLKKIVHSGEGGRTNHPKFSPDSSHIVFTSDYAAVSAEPISNPHHYQPYGDIFVARTDGTEIQRLTHNSYEDGTPTWGPMYLEPVDVVHQSNPDGSACQFDDCYWLA